MKKQNSICMFTLYLLIQQIDFIYVILSLIKYYNNASSA